MGEAPTLAPLLRKLTARSHLTAAESAAILNLPHRIRRHGRDAYLAHEGKRSDHVALLLSGLCYAQKWTGAGAKQILAIQVPGDLVGLAPSMLPTADHDLRALTTVMLAEIPREALLDLARAHPAIGQALWLDMVIGGAIEREWIVNVGRRSARQRIAHLLCELAWRFEDNGICAATDFECPLTQDHIADAIATTPVHVNRTIKAMRTEGLVKSSRQAISIPNLAALRTAGEFNPAYLYQR